MIYVENGSSTRSILFRTRFLICSRNWFLTIRAIISMRRKFRSRFISLDTWQRTIPENHHTNLSTNKHIFLSWKERICFLEHTTPTQITAVYTLTMNQFGDESRILIDLQRSIIFLKPPSEVRDCHFKKMICGFFDFHVIFSFFRISFKKWRESVWQQGYFVFLHKFWSKYFVEESLSHTKNDDVINAS